MKLLMLKYAPIVVLGAIAVICILGYNQKKYFDWIQKHWFLKKSFYSMLSFSSLILSFIFLLLSLLDVRGPQEQMEVNVPDQKTIIMIDVSASMLVEDVKPSRFERSLFMAKHFIKKAVGHQVSVVLFSDIQKKIVPFTDDIDLLDARISVLKSLDITKGGSNIGRAIQESLRYFQLSDKNIKDISGNILIFSDSEESEGSFDIEIPSKINVALVGVGTLNGGKIPLRGRDGRFRGYKRYGGDDVVSKLDENYIRKLGSKVNKYKYWIASSYSIYTDEIIKFFERNFLENFESSNLASIRPVLSHYISSIGILFYVLSMIFSQFRSFQKFLAIGLLAFVGDGFQIQADTGKDLEELKKGRLDKIQRLKLAEKFLRKEEEDKALKLYRENVTRPEEADFSVLLNYGVALFKKGQVEEGMKIYNELQKNPRLGEQEKDALRKNIMKALEEHDKKQQQPGEEEQNEDSGNEGGEGRKEGEGGGEKNEQKKNKNNQDREGQDRDGQKDDKDDKESEKGEQKEDEKSQNGEERGKNKNNQEREESSRKVPAKTGRESWEDRKKNMEKHRNLVKIPETLKGILNEDRFLQKKAFGTDTDKNKNEKIKDW